MRRRRPNPPIGPRWRRKHPEHGRLRNRLQPYAVTDPDGTEAVVRASFDPAPLLD